MKISLVQFEAKINLDLDKILTRVKNFIKKSSLSDYQLICSPEDFLYGPLDYYQNKQIKNILKNNPFVIKWFSEKAKQYQINIIAGTIITKIKSQLFNTCYVFNNQGNIIYTHHKQKLVPYGFENQFINPGKNQLKVFKIKNINCGVLICRELFYPQLFQTLRKQQVEIIFIPAFWSKRSSDYNRHKLTINIIY